MSSIIVGIRKDLAMQEEEKKVEGVVMGKIKYIRKV